MMPTKTSIGAKRGGASCGDAASAALTNNAGETAEYISNASPTEGTHSSSQTALAALRAKSQEPGAKIYYILYTI
jgi:hypothetical protein